MKRQRGSIGAKRNCSFERKRRKALNDLAANEDWLDGKVDPMPRPRKPEVGRLCECNVTV